LQRSANIQESEWDIINVIRGRCVAAENKVQRALENGHNPEIPHGFLVEY